MKRGKIFSKAPLKEVLFEIRFSPDISAACKKDVFFSEIKKFYPEVVFPNLALDKHPLARPIQYLNSEKTKIITFDAESLSFSTTRYESFGAFKGECSFLINAFKKAFPTINRIKGTGFRYINHILAERKGNVVDLGKYLEFTFSLPSLLTKNTLEFFQTAFFIVLEKDISGIRVGIDNFKNDKKADVLMLDLDLISLKQIDVGKVEEYLVGYHDQIEEVFLSIITEEYKGSIE